MLNHKILTVIIQRECYLKFSYDRYFEGSVSERTEILYDENPDELIAQCKEVIESFVHEEVDDEAYEPEFIVLHGGVPSTNIWDEEELSYVEAVLHTLQKYAKEFRTEYVKEKARKANDERLARERAEKEERERRELAEYQRLSSKYGK